MRAELAETLREARFHLKSLRGFFLSHHPDCERFGSDVIRIGRIRLCKGCFIGYGLALLLTTLFLSIPRFQGLFENLDPIYIAMVGGILIGTQVIRAFIPLNTGTFKTVQKILFGIGLFLLAASLVLLDAALVTKGAIVATFLLLGGGVSSVLRPYYILRTCKGCHWRENWNDCPGIGRSFKKKRDRNDRPSQHLRRGGHG